VHATNDFVTTGSGENFGFNGDSDLGDGWDSVRGDSDIQFEPMHYPAPQVQTVDDSPAPQVQTVDDSPADPWEAPQWLVDIGNFLYDVFSGLGNLLGMSWPVFSWVLIAIAALCILALLWRMLAPVLGYRRLRLEVAAESEEGWAPNRSEALTLLEEADRLAANGSFEEATHLLLQRSVEQIRTARPKWLGPSSTAREIAGLPALPDTARSAFSTIAERVERSLFALRSLSLDDWQAARSAYAEFALADLRAEVRT
jgi:hypothetical protein